ncbi:PAS domain-containing protein [Pyxidicoccus fallax]|nr:PAS domain-containing protein [Pyxidicoccus fallax]
MDREAIEGITAEQSRGFLETMVACAPVGLGFVDLDLRFIHINDALASMNGLPREAHLGRKVRDVVPELWPFIEPHYRQVLETGQPILGLEVTGPTAREPGVERDFQVNYYPVRDGNGRLQGVGLTVVETTEQRRAHRALRMSERRYRSLVESMAQTVWTTNGRGELVEPAPRWLAFTGQSHGAHLGLGWFDAIHPSDRTRFVSEWTTSLETRAPYQGELRLRSQDGGYREVVVRSVPVFDDRGAVREWISTAEDITERKRAEAGLRRTTRALQESDERYRTFVSQSTEGIWRLEVEPPIDTHLPEDEQVRALLSRSRVAEANDVMARMTGFASPSEMQGTTLWRMISMLTHGKAAVEDAVRPFIHEGYRLVDVETRQPGPDGTERVRLANLVGVVEQGRLVRVWGTQRDVTDRMRTREALEHSRELIRVREHQLRAITDALPALVAYVDRDERYLFCNRAFETWFGQDPEALVGQCIRGLSGEMGYAHMKDWMRKALAGETVNYESALTLQDGRTLHVQSTYVPTRDARGNVKGFVALVHDITDRKRAEAEVEAQRSRLYDVLMSIPASIGLFSGPDLVFTLVNPIYQRLAAGVDLTGQSLVALAKRNRNIEFYCQAARDVYASGKPLFLREQPIRMDYQGRGISEERAFDLAFVPLRDAGGRVDSVMTFAIDVTSQVRDRQKVEELAAHLTNQQQWLESVLNLLPVAFLLIEPGTGRIFFANQAAYRMGGGHVPLNVPLEGYLDAYLLTDEEDVPLTPDRIPALRASRGERLHRAPVVWHTATGRYDLLTDSEALPAMHGHPATVVLALQDVTRLKQTEARLQEAVRLRDEFLTVASHELKTPLTPLQIKLQALAREAQVFSDGERLRCTVLRTAESASVQIRKLTALINDLLDGTQLTGETLPLRREEVDLSAIAREAAEQFRTQAAQAACELVVEAPAPVVGWWDGHRLQQVVRGLLSNAIKYGPGRPVVLQVERRGERARLTVSDEGIGIAPEDLTRIFEKFGRAVSARNYGGLGLGLFISRRIVEAHQGTIRARSQPGQGATFTVELPMMRRPPEATVH